MKRNLFEEGEIPYMTLSSFGLTKEMIEDLPQHVLEDICSGHKSPALPISVRDSKGTRIEGRTRFALIRKDNSSVDVLFYPVMQNCDLSRFKDKEKEHLMAGKALISDVDTQDGHTVKAFVQIDPETNQVQSVPTPVIGRNLQVCADQLGLDAEDLQCIQRGATVSFLLEGGTVTMGIDLNSKTGIRFCNGDFMRWKSQARDRMKDRNFGLNGCWLKDESGNLQYVRESDYSEEMWQQQKEEAQARVAHMMR